MGNLSRSKDSSVIGVREVTSKLIAYLVDRYLYDNRFSETRTLFRSEASSLISSSSRLQVPDSFMTLDGIVNDYIRLKMQKRTMDQDRMRLVQEQVRVQNLLQEIQNGKISAYNASLITPSPPLPPMASAPTSQQIHLTSGSHQYNTPNVMSVPLQGDKQVGFGNYSTSSTSQPTTRKRKGPEAAVGAPLVTRQARITRAKENSTALNGTNKIPQADKAANNFSSQTPFDTLASARNSAANELIGHGSSMEKCLLNRADLWIPTNSTCFRTPQKSATPASDKSNSLQKVGAPPVTRKARISRAKKNSTANGTNKIPQADRAASNFLSQTPFDTLASAKNSAANELIGHGSSVDKYLFNKAELPVPTRKARSTRAKKNSTANRTNKIQQADKAATNLSQKPSSPGSDKSNFTHVKGRLNFNGIDTEMCLEATADLASNSPSEFEPVIELSDLETPLELDDIDVAFEGSARHCLSQTPNAPVQNLSGSSPESGNKILQSVHFMSESTAVNEAVQEKDMSSQGYDAKTAPNSTTQRDGISSRGDHVKGRLNFDGIDTKMCLDATADLASTSPSSTSPSGLEPAFDLSGLAIPDLVFCYNFTLSEPLDGLGIQKFSGSSSPESENKSLEPDQDHVEI